MNEQNTFCGECGTENEPAYEFCKNCGAPLAKRTPEPPPPPPPVAPFQTFAQPMPAEPFAPAANAAVGGYVAEDGIPSEDLALFIGKKANVYLPKFMAMDLTGSKVSWSWSLAVLGFLLGPIGASFWFFYRKMFKPALILLAIGTVVNFATTALSHTVSIDPSMLTDDPEVAFSYFLEVISSETTILDIASGLINNTAKIATCVITGLFGTYLYKKHCISKISTYRQSGIDMRYYKLGLSSAGGTSGGYLAIGIIAFFVLTALPSNILHLISLLFS